MRAGGEDAAHHRGGEEVAVAHARDAEAGRLQLRQPEARGGGTSTSFGACSRLVNTSHASTAAIAITPS